MLKVLRASFFMAACVAVATITPHRPEFTWWATATFVSLALSLDLLDLASRQGEAMEMNGPLAVAAVLVLSPIAGLVVVIASRIVATVITSRARPSSSAVSSLERRGVSLGVAAVTLVSLGASTAAMPAVWGAIIAAVIVVGVDTTYSRWVSRLQSAMDFPLVVGRNLQTPIVLAQVSVCALFVVTYAQMSLLSLAITFLLLLLIRQAYASLFEIRMAYHSTIQVMVDAAEGLDESRRGHAKRVSEIATKIAASLGLAALDIERISYGALLHDVDLIAYDEGEQPSGPRHAGALVRDVGFLSSVSPLLDICDGKKSSAPVSRDTLAAAIIALASDIDDIDRGKRPTALKRAVNAIPDGMLSDIRRAAATLKI